MTKTDKQVLRDNATEATGGSWVRESGEGWEAICCDDDQGNAGFIIAEFQGKDAAANRKFVQSANPATVLALLDELEAKDIVRSAQDYQFDQQADRIAELENELGHANARNDAKCAQLCKQDEEIGTLRQRIAELENDEVRQRLANAEHQLHMAELAKHNLKASRKAQFRKRKAAERRVAEMEARTLTVKLPRDCEHDVMAPVAAFMLNDGYEFDGEDYTSLSGRVRNEIETVLRRTLRSAGIALDTGD